MYDTVTKMMSITMISSSIIRINTIRNYYHIYLFGICKLVTVIIARPICSSISDSMHDTELNVVSRTVF